MSRRIIELPWVHDHHSHVSLYAALADCPDLSRLDKPEALALLRSLPPDRLSVVLGWYSARLNFTEGELRSLPPAIIANYSLHGVLLTAGGRDRLKGSDPELVERHGDIEWCERNLAKLLAVYVRSASLTPEKLDAFMRSLQGLGVGSAEDMAVTGEEALDVVRRSPWNGRLRCWADPDVYRSLGPQARERVAGFKIFTDGALGLRTAALAEPFNGGEKGILLHTDKELEEKLARLSRLARPLSIHALGGRAIEQALMALERLGADGVRLARVRLEHVQFISEAQAARAKAAGLTLSMQPNFSADSRDYADRLSQRLRAANNPFRMLIDRAGFKPGKDLIFGSDGMPHGMEAALQWSLFPDHPGQVLTLEEVREGYGPALGEGGMCRLKLDEDARRVELLESRPRRG